MCTITLKILYASNNKKMHNFKPFMLIFLQIGQFLDLPVKVDFTGKPVKQFYRFLPVLTNKKLQPYFHFSIAIDKRDQFPTYRYRLFISRALRLRHSGNDLNDQRSAHAQATPCF